MSLGRWHTDVYQAAVCVCVWAVCVCVCVCGGGGGGGVQGYSLGTKLSQQLIERVWPGQDSQTNTSMC